MHTARFYGSVFYGSMSAWPYVIAPHHGQVEGQQLQGDDAQDALQAVHRVRQLDGLVGVLHDVLVVPATQDDGPALQEEERSVKTHVPARLCLCPVSL